MNQTTSSLLGPFQYANQQFYTWYKNLSIQLTRLRLLNDSKGASKRVMKLTRYLLTHLKLFCSTYLLSTLVQLDKALGMCLDFTLMPLLRLLLAIYHSIDARLTPSIVAIKERIGKWLKIDKLGQYMITTVPATDKNRPDSPKMSHRNGYISRCLDKYGVKIEFQACVIDGIRHHRVVVKPPSLTQSKQSHATLSNVDHRADGITLYFIGQATCVENRNTLESLVDHAYRTNRIVIGWNQRNVNNSGTVALSDTTNPCVRTSHDKLGKQLYHFHEDSMRDDVKKQADYTYQHDLCGSYNESSLNPGALLDVYGICYGGLYAAIAAHHLKDKSLFSHVTLSRTPISLADMVAYSPNYARYFTKSELVKDLRSMNAKLDPCPHRFKWRCLVYTMNALGHLPSPVRRRLLGCIFSFGGWRLDITRELTDLSLKNQCTILTLHRPGRIPIYDKRPFTYLAKAINQYCIQPWFDPSDEFIDMRACASQINTTLSKPVPTYQMFCIPVEHKHALMTQSFHTTRQNINQLCPQQALIDQMKTTPVKDQQVDPVVYQFYQNQHSLRQQVKTDNTPRLPYLHDFNHLRDPYFCLGLESDSELKNPLNRHQMWSQHGWFLIKQPDGTSCVVDEIEASNLSPNSH
ncbi:MAG: hypothetical protein VXY77_04335 [Pseudomonadota bacterium]|nr:hypothetical protein [Pseudomonadota bacterium]